MVDFLRDFIHILRSSDLRVSTSESIDAMNAVSKIGFNNKSLLRDSLSFSLAKTLREKEIFNKVVLEKSSIAKEGSKIKTFIVKVYVKPELMNTQNIKEDNN